MPSDPDPNGYQLFGQRVKHYQNILADMLENPIKARFSTSADHFYITGTGSSQAHAQFLCYLINFYTLKTATFLPLSAFYGTLRKGNKPNSTLIVISQGLSPNARMALKCRHQFASVVLFTATHLENLVSSDQFSKRALLEALHKEPTSAVIHFPVEDEYSLLIRTIGPMAGYMAMIQFVESLFPGTIPTAPFSRIMEGLEAPNDANLAPILDILQPYLETKCSPFFLANYPLSVCLDNIAYKIVEGLFLPHPFISDYMSFSHGPFQQLMAQKRPLLVISTPSDSDKALFKNTEGMLQKTGCPFWHLELSLPMPWAVFELEALFNDLVQKLMPLLKINQKNWPGKGLEGPLYNLEEPFKG